MPKYVAFLRAINVGGHTVKMDHLRSLFQAMGFSNVETFIASGNVIFDSKTKATKALENKIECALEADLGYQVATFIRSMSELAAVAQYKPFHEAELNTDGNVLFVGFVADNPSEESKRRLLSSTTEVDDFHIYGREVYWLCRKKLGDSDFYGPKFEKTLGMPATLRNSNTVVKIALKYS
ncbi:MAG: DUF1697 domain-containing protein [Acidobacteriota bacterium]|nr:DUF1697 domain-containing protein [Acidobacteriota bacterium]